MLQSFVDNSNKMLYSEDRIRNRKKEEARMHLLSCIWTGSGKGKPGEAVMAMSKDIRETLCEMTAEDWNDSMAQYCEKEDTWSYIKRLYKEKKWNS